MNILGVNTIKLVRLCHKSQDICRISNQLLVETYIIWCGSKHSISYYLHLFLLQTYERHSEDVSYRKLNCTTTSTTPIDKKNLKVLCIQNKHVNVILNQINHFSDRNATILFNKLRPKTVSSQLTFTCRFNGSEYPPSVVMVIKHTFMVLSISPLNRKHNPDVSSTLAETGISTETKKTLALLSTFDASFRHTARILSPLTGLLSSWSNFSMWLVKMQLLQMNHDKLNKKSKLRYEMNKHTLV